MKLNKQLIEKVAKGDVAIDNTGNPNLELLRAVLKEAFPQDKDISHGKAHFYQTVEGKYWSGHHKTSLPTIPLLDFLEKEEAFPLDDFGVLVENGNGKEIVEYLVSKGFNNYNQFRGTDTDCYYGIKNNQIECGYRTYFSKTYTLQQLKQLDMENKKIIGYKLIKPEYEHAYRALTNTANLSALESSLNELDWVKVAVQRLKDTGVLDLWFEPVYEETKILTKMIDKINDEFIVDCTNNSKEERQQVYKFLVDNRNYSKSYLEQDFPVIACNKKEGASHWETIANAKLYKNRKNHPVYTFEQFKKMYLEEEFVLPEKWCIKRDAHSDKVITDWFNKKSNYNFHIGNIKFPYVFFPIEGGLLSSSLNHKGYKEITFEQFKKYILKQETMKKEIIGYKLIKEYPNSKSLGYFEKYTTGKLSQYPEYWQPVYKEEKTTIKMYSSNKGEFEIEVVGKKAYYRPDSKELTKEFIAEILDWFDDSTKHYYQSSKKVLYTLKVDSLKVGCMEGTRQADWQKVYDLIK